MNAIINMAVKFSGMGWVWDKMDGYKTYGAAAVSILTGLLGLLQEFGPVLASHNAGAAFHLLQGMPKDQSWQMVMAGVGLLGLGHKMEKAGGDYTPPQGPPIPAAKP